MSLQRDVKLSAWSRKGYLAVGSSKEIKEFNNYLNTIKLRILEIHRDLISSGSEVSGQAIKNKFHGIETGQQQHFLLEIFKEHNRRFEALVGIEYAHNTLKKFRTCLSLLTAFIKLQYKKDDIELRDLDHGFVLNFEFYLKTVNKCAHNSAMVYVKKLKKITRECIAMNWLDKDPFMSFKVTIKDVRREILSQPELEAIEQKVLQIRRLDAVRDIFLFCCYTGLSFCDVTKLTKTNVVIGADGNKWIHISRTKTDIECRIPLLPMAEQILAKYQNDDETSITSLALPVSSNQKMNSYLKELTELCDLNKDLTFHCARHTFATTVCLANGVPIETVGKLLGHKSLKTTQIYAKILDLKVASDMSNLKERLKKIS
jgi:site-specific recombinase XerD